MISMHCFAQLSAGPDSNNVTFPRVNRAAEKPKTAQPDISIYPNPAKNKITIQVKGFKPGMVSVKLLDTKGKQVREDSRLLTNGTEDIIMFLMLKAGIYFILVSEPGKIARKKLVIL